MAEEEIAVPLRSRGMRAGARLALGAIRVSLAVSPRPTALLLRQLFASSGAKRAAALRPLAPEGVDTIIDELYGPHRDCLLDVYRPAEAVLAARQLPVLVWVHGGAFVGGTKDEIDYYFRAVTRAGFCVVAVRYSLAPEFTYPTPVRQVMAALAHVQAHAVRFGADPNRIVLAGDSAGSHISAQLAAAITNPDYARRVGVPSTISADDLRAVVLCCGIYDFATAANDASMKTFMLACGWAYSGTRDFLNDRYFMSTTAVADHITEAFPPALLTVGNVDPLRTQTETISAVLQRQGVWVETLFYPREHQPPLTHEYQFDLSLADAVTALDRLTDFLRRHTS